MKNGAPILPERRDNAHHYILSGYLASLMQLSRHVYLKKVFLEIEKEIKRKIDRYVDS